MNYKDNDIYSFSTRCILSFFIFNSLKSLGRIFRGQWGNFWFICSKYFSSSIIKSTQTYGMLCAGVLRSSLGNFKLLYIHEADYTYNIN